METIKELKKLVDRIGIVDRRPLDDEVPDGLMESDNDFVKNNIEVAVWLLENAIGLLNLIDYE